MRIYIDNREAYLMKRALLAHSENHPTVKQECYKLIGKIIQCQDLQKSGGGRNAKQRKND